jgi:hypothetical protein
MNVLFFGDIVGQAGCDRLRSELPRLKKEFGATIVIANGENSAEGNGITPHSAKHLFDSGVNIITSGNHVLRRREIYELLEEKNGLIRPANSIPARRERAGISMTTPGSPLRREFAAGHGVQWHTFGNPLKLRTGYDFRTITCAPDIIVDFPWGCARRRPPKSLPSAHNLGRQGGFRRDRDAYACGDRRMSACCP